MSHCKNHIIICPTCNQPFRSSPSAKRQFCSRDCTPYTRQNQSHGRSRTRLYVIWSNMKNRCTCPTNIVFCYYGGRGVTVCNEWSQSFDVFAKWAASSGYCPDLELDRIDTNGNYCPFNCRWATRHEQMRNRRKPSNAKTSRFKGVSWCANVGKWRSQLRRNGKPFHIGLFASEVDAALAYNTAAMREYGEFAHINVVKKEFMPS